IRELEIEHVRGTEHITESDFGNYEQVAGVWMPFSIEWGRKGGPRFGHLVIEHAEVNVEADDALFRFPAPGKAIERAIPAAAAAPAAASTPPKSSVAGTPRFDSGVISGLGARNIGSAAMSGRISAVAARNDDGKTTLYVGAASGGVWKSIDGGTTFKP